MQSRVCFGRYPTDSIDSSDDMCDFANLYKLSLDKVRFKHKKSHKKSHKKCQVYNVTGFHSYTDEAFGLMILGRGFCTQVMQSVTKHLG